MAMLVDSEKMTTAHGEIEQASEDFKNKGTAFIADLTTALSTFEGETKDALMDKKLVQQVLKLKEHLRTLLKNKFLN